MTMVALGDAVLHPAAFGEISDLGPIACRRQRNWRGAAHDAQLEADGIKANLRTAFGTHIVPSVLDR